MSAISSKSVVKLKHFVISFCIFDLRPGESTEELLGNFLLFLSIFDFAAAANDCLIFSRVVDALIGYLLR